MNQFTFRKLLAAALLALALPASAQKMITFESQERTGAYKRKHHEDNGRNSLTIGLVSWMNGYTPVYYERAIVGVLSVQIGVGFTSRSYMNDLGMSVWAEGDNNSNVFLGSDDIADNYQYYKYRKASVGPYLSIAPKIYFGEDNLMDGSYVSPMFEYKSYRYNAQLADVTKRSDSYYGVYDDRDVPHTSQTVKEHMNCMDLTINVGGHYQTDSHLTVGWNIGLGVRHTSNERLDLGQSPDGGGNYYYANNIVTYNKTKPLFSFNFVLGGWF